MAKVSFDGTTKIISVTASPINGEVNIDVKIDLYSDWKEWVLLSDNAKYDQALRAVGGDPLPGSKALGITYFLMNGWRIRPYEGNHTMNVNGNLYTEEGDSPYIPTIGSFNVMLISAVSSLVDSTVQQLPEIEHMAFGEVVHLDVNSGNPGTEYPTGTYQHPVNNLADAKAIAAERGFDTIHLVSNLTVGATESISGFCLVGKGADLTTITLTSGCTTSATRFEDLTVTGRQSGETHYKNCDIGELSNIHCLFDRCRLIGPMSFHSSYSDTSVFVDCYTGDIAGATTVFDLNNSPVHISMNGFRGKLQINNLNKATAGVITINADSGKIILDSSCTTGTIKVRGICELVNNTNGTTVDMDNIQVDTFLTEDNFLALK